MAIARRSKFDVLGTRTTERCPPNDQLLENKTERQTVSPTRWEQEPGALLTKRLKALPDPRSVPMSPFSPSCPRFRLHGIAPQGLGTTDSRRAPWRSTSFGVKIRQANRP